MSQAKQPEIDLSPRQELFNELIAIFDGVTKRDAAPLHVIILWFEAIGADSAAHFLREFSKEYNKAHPQRAAGVPPADFRAQVESAIPEAGKAPQAPPANDKR